MFKEMNKIAFEKEPNESPKNDNNKHERSKTLF